MPSGNRKPKPFRPVRWFALSSLAIFTSVTLVVVLAASAPGLLVGNLVPSQGALSSIPAGWLSLYVSASTACPGLPWTILAAIGTVESDNGVSQAPGVHSGSNSAGAEGPMQFLPSTFAEYDEPVPPGGTAPPTPYDPIDAVYAAARDLCANGARGGADLARAIFAYNHDSTYVAEVLRLASTYGTALSAPAPSEAAATAVAFALEQLGTPYQWGGEGPSGFDCSGLVQAAYAEAGIALPRVAQDQFDAGPHLPPSIAPEAGDLVFFGGGISSIEHVGIVVAPGQMVDAPNTGAVVRIDEFPTTPGAAWGSQIYVGATRPWA